METACSMIRSRKSVAVGNRFLQSTAHWTVLSTMHRATGRSRSGRSSAPLIACPATFLKRQGMLSW
jgi:hypothetical protein